MMLGGVGEVGEDVGVDVDEAPDEHEKGGSKDDAARRPTINFSGRIIECSADGILGVLELVATEIASKEHYEQPFLDDCEHPARSFVIRGVHQRALALPADTVQSFGDLLCGVDNAPNHDSNGAFESILNPDTNHLFACSPPSTLSSPKPSIPSFSRA